MKAFSKELLFETEKRCELVDITGQVEDALRGLRGNGEGLCLVNAMHITASVFINDDESGLHADFLEWLEKAAPPRAGVRVPAQRRRGQRRRAHQAADLRSGQALTGARVSGYKNSVECRCSSVGRAMD
jgi:thiamine phosphate synthase YjbQ (UPF0047 family)